MQTTTLAEVLGSPEISDHDRIRRAAERIAWSLEPPTSTSTRRWRSGSGVATRTVVQPSRSRRDGVQRDPARNVAAHLLHEVLGLSWSELGAELGITRSAAAAAARRGARTVHAARSRTDPRAPSRATPSRRNERPW